MLSASDHIEENHVDLHILYMSVSIVLASGLSLASNSFDGRSASPAFPTFQYCNTRKQDAMYFLAIPKPTNPQLSLAERWAQSPVVELSKEPSVQR